MRRTLTNKGEVMTEAKQEALRQALQYHQFTGAIGEKKATPEQIVTTAKKFESFLVPNTKRK